MLRVTEMGKAKAESAAEHDHGASPQGILLGQKVGSVDLATLDPNATLESLFGSELSGAALLEQMLSWFQDTELQKLEWYSNDGQSVNRNILRAPQSRAIQESTVARYMGRIYNEGLSQVVSGAMMGLWQSTVTPPPQ